MRLTPLDAHRPKTVPCFSSGEAGEKGRDPLRRRGRPGFTGAVQGTRPRRSDAGATEGPEPGEAVARGLEGQRSRTAARPDGDLPRPPKKKARVIKKYAGSSFEFCSWAISDVSIGVRGDFGRKRAGGRAFDDLRSTFALSGAIWRLLPICGVFANFTLDLPFAVRSFSSDGLATFSTNSRFAHVVTVW